jgi:hypothetical protein
MSCADMRPAVIRTAAIERMIFFIIVINYLN